MSDADPPQEEAKNELIEAIKSQDLPALQSQLRDRDDLDTMENGLTPLMWAAYFGNLPAVKDILMRGATADKKNSVGQTATQIAEQAAEDEDALQWDCATIIAGWSGGMLRAVEYSRVAPVEWLVANKEKFTDTIDEFDQDSLSGNNALMYASTHGDADMVKLLLKLGANVFKKNKVGATALELAEDDDIADMLDRAEQDMVASNPKLAPLRSPRESFIDTREAEALYQKEVEKKQQTAKELRHTRHISFGIVDYTADVKKSDETIDNLKQELIEDVQANPLPGSARGSGSHSRVQSTGSQPGAHSRQQSTHSRAESAHSRQSSGQPGGSNAHSRGSSLQAGGPGSPASNEPYKSPRLYKGVYSPEELDEQVTHQPYLDILKGTREDLSTPAPVDSGLTLPSTDPTYQSQKNEVEASRQKIMESYQQLAEIEDLTVQQVPVVPTQPARAVCGRHGCTTGATCVVQ